MQDIINRTHQERWPIETDRKRPLREFVLSSHLQHIYIYIYIERERERERAWERGWRDDVSDAKSTMDV